MILPSVRSAPHLLALAGLLITSPHGTTADAADAAVQLTDAPGVDAWPEWSPDGEWLAFASQRSGANAIWIMRPDGSDLRQLTDAPQGDWNPNWSPDGSRIAFESFRSGNKDIWIVPADGGEEPTQLTVHTTEDTSPAWSPDGTQIVFCSSRWADLEIWIIPAEGGAATALQTTASRFDGLPAWSPDGNEIAIQGAEPGRPTDIWLLPTFGGPGRRLTTTAFGEYHPSWSPGADWIAVSAAFLGVGPRRIWVLDADTGEASPVTAPEAGRDGSPAWSPDGGRIAFASTRDGDDDIYVIDLATVDVADAASSPVPPGVVASPSPFRRSTTIRVTDAGSDGASRLWIFDATGRQVRRLSSARSTVDGVTFHWDGHNDVGEPASAGVYFLQLEQDGVRVAVGRVSRIAGT